LSKKLKNVDKEMKAVEPQEILAEGRLEAWQQLTATIEARHNVKTVKAPETCLAMMQAVDSVGETPFYLGEVLMCEAAARVDGVIGYGFALEDDPERAWCLAVIDAALAAGLPEGREIRAAIDGEGRQLLEERRLVQDLVAGTMVRFAVMEGQ
jgi:alpha-D-ribose 1-methylphosphonate 5-triphosphate synthase subunit PhnG